PMYYEETVLSAHAGEVQLTTRRVWQAGADRYRIEAVDAAGGTMLTIADGSQLWVIDPVTDTVLCQPLTEPAWQLPAAAAGGRITQGTFAGRPVHIVTLRANRQTYTYIIDAEHAILLKEEVT